ncbi:MAG: hypothetical protein NWE98_06770 [Candidatus Bathyarchaeota archaeon]|nr:hypothetical protein [Candidatus Bathyarchaeota archaeon]
MPRKGYKCITVTEKVHREIQRRAYETDRTMKQYIEFLLINDDSQRR